MGCLHSKVDALEKHKSNSDVIQRKLHSNSAGNQVQPRKCSDQSKSIKVAFEETANIKPWCSEKDFLKAVKQGNVSIVRQVIAHKLIDLNIKGMWDNTPLIIACMNGYEDIAIALLESGVNPNCVNEKGNTALLHASIEGMVHTVDKLLECGAYVDIHPSIIYNSTTDSNEYLTPLTAALLNSYDTIAKMLLERNASIKVESNPNISTNDTSIECKSTLLAACLGNNVEILHHLLNRKDVDINERLGKEEKTLLYVAIEKGLRTDIILLLLRRGANANLATQNGDTCLLHATRKNDISTMQILIQGGADVNLPNTDGRTALHEATNNESVIACQVLLESNANPTLADRYGTTALEIAIANDNDELQNLMQTVQHKESNTRVAEPIP